LKESKDVLANSESFDGKKIAPDKALFLFLRAVLFLL
jgi:hypothetical protein